MLRTAVRAGAWSVRTHWWTWLRTAVVLQLVTALVTGPAIALLLRAALGSAGVPSLTEASLGQVLRHPVSVAFLLGLAVVATSAVLIQHAAFVLVGRELREGRVPRLRALVADASGAVRRVLGLQLALVAAYLLLIAPVGGFALGASLVRALEVPPFVAGELQKTPLGTSVWLGAAGLLLYVNLRLLLVPTVLVTTHSTPAGAYTASWRATRGRALPLGLLAVALWLLAALTLRGWIAASVWLTRVTETVWPVAATAAAGLMLAVGQLVLVVGSGLGAALVACTLLELIRPRPPLGSSPVEAPPHAARPGLVAGLVLGAVVAVAAAGGAAQLRSPAPGSATLVVAHRGATYGAVENTVESLEAAAALGADLVELDVLQAADGGLVVVHDTNLRRIAGVNRNVFDMTTAELTTTVVRQAGHTSTVPTFDDYAARAAELGVPLLVEVKRHGRERGDLVGDIVTVLEQHGLADTSVVQAFDRGTVTEIEQRFPHLTTGWVIAFFRGTLDPGAADVVTLEQSSYTPSVLRQAHVAGVRVLLWTVTDPLRMRTFTRQGVDGLITAFPQRALAERALVEAETGVADRLADTLRSLVT